MFLKDGNMKSTMMILKNKLHDYKCYFFMFMENFTIRGIKRNVKFFIQRCTRGWDEREVWNLDRTLGAYIYPRLIEFKKIKHGYPDDISEEIWDHHLDEMVFAFKTLSEDDNYLGFDQETFDRIQNGLNLFAKYYTALWD